MTQIKKISRRFRRSSQVFSAMTCEICGSNKQIDQLFPDAEFAEYIPEHILCTDLFSSDLIQI
jgi:thioredoxin-related protein